MSDVLQFIISAKDEFSGAFGKLTGYLPSVKTLAVGAGAAIVGYGASMIAATKATAEAHDKVQKFAERVGMSTEALSRYHYAAQMSDVSQETFNKSIQGMTRRIAEATAGTGAAADTLKVLGINIDAIYTRSPDRQFQVLAEALDGVRNQSDRARIATQMFGEEGVALLNMLSNGAAGLREMTAEADRFGVTVSAKAGANAAAFNDSLTRVTASLTGLRNVTAEKVMPIITGLSNRFAYFVADNRDAIVDFGDTFAGVMMETATVGILAVGRLIDGWRGFQSFVQQLRAGFYEFSASILSGADLIQEKMREMLAAVNVGGVFDATIEQGKQVQMGNLETIQSLQNAAAQAYLTISELASRTSATEQIEELVARVKGAIAEIKAEGDAQVSTGMAPFDDASTARSIANIQTATDAQKASYDQLLSMRDQYLLSEYGRLEQWYAEQRELYTGQQEELALIDEIYRARKGEADMRQAEMDTQYKEQMMAREQASKQKQLGALSAMGMAFGKQGFEAAKALSIPQTMMSTYVAAMESYKALAGIPYVGPALGAAAAAAAIAYGMQQVAQVRSQKYGAAHGGLDYVPAETTMLLDQGERVVSPKQNRDLTSFLSEERGGGIEIGALTLNLEIKATTRDELLNMSRADWHHVIVDRLVPGLRGAARDGVTI